VYQYASYVAVNISSPNTKNLRQLQGGDELDALLAQLKAEQLKLADTHKKYVPLAVKIAPDLDSEQIKQIAALLIKHKIDGVIATNTTLSREGVENLPHGNETGGLSGAPVKDKSTAVIRQLATELNGALPIIGVGGILRGADAMEKMQAGAALVQVYSGLVYRGQDVMATSFIVLCIHFLGRSLTDLSVFGLNLGGSNQYAVLLIAIVLIIYWLGMYLAYSVRDFGIQNEQFHLIEKYIADIKERISTVEQYLNDKSVYGGYRVEFDNLTNLLAVHDKQQTRTASVRGLNGILHKVEYWTPIIVGIAAFIILLIEIFHIN